MQRVSSLADKVLWDGEGAVSVRRLQSDETHSVNGNASVKDEDEANVWDVTYMRQESFHALFPNGVVRPINGWFTRFRRQRRIVKSMENFGVVTKKNQVKNGNAKLEHGRWHRWEDPAVTRNIPAPTSSKTVNTIATTTEPDDSDVIESNAPTAMPRLYSVRTCRDDINGKRLLVRQNAVVFNRPSHAEGRLSISSLSEESVPCAIHEALQEVRLLRRVSSMTSLGMLSNIPGDNDQHTPLMMITSMFQWGEDDDSKESDSDLLLFCHTQQQGIKNPDFSEDTTSCLSSLDGELEQTHTHLFNQNPGFHSERSNKNANYSASQQCRDQDHEATIETMMSPTLISDKSPRDEHDLLAAGTDQLQTAQNAPSVSSGGLSKCVSASLSPNPTESTLEANQNSHEELRPSKYGIVFQEEDDSVLEFFLACDLQDQGLESVSSICRNLHESDANHPVECKHPHSPWKVNDGGDSVPNLDKVSADEAMDHVSLANAEDGLGPNVPLVRKNKGSPRSPGKKYTKRYIPPTSLIPCNTTSNHQDHEQHETSLPSDAGVPVTEGAVPVTENNNYSPRPWRRVRGCEDTEEPPGPLRPPNRC